jgi:hypothetical protein
MPSPEHIIFWVYDILSHMNYRRGFQRLYVVLAAGWILAALVVLPSERIRFWHAEQRLGNLSGSTSDVPAHENIFDQLARERESLQTHTERSEQTKKPLTVVSSVDDAPAPESRLRKALWLAGVLIGPPATGYGFLFFVIPWIYRGFRPASRM